MMGRSFNSLAVVCVLLLGPLVIAVPAAAQAQDQTHYTYVSFWGVPRAQWNDFEKSEEQTRPVFERLVADGTLVAWGQADNLIHTEDGYTHSDWFISTSQAGIVKALEALQNSSRTPALASATEAFGAMQETQAHRDSLSRVLA
jgi:hypothetical protein